MLPSPAHPSTRSKHAGGLLRILPGLALLTMANFALHASTPRAKASWSELENFQRLGGATTAVAAWQDHAYAAVGSQLWAFALGEDGPQAVGRPLDLPDLPEAMAAFQGRLYLPVRATGGAGMASLFTYDLRQPDAPEPIGRPVTLGVREVGAIAVDYPQLYLLTERGLSILDIKDPDAPQAWLELPMQAPAGASAESAWRGALAAQGEQVWIARDWGLFRVGALAARPSILPIDYRPARSLAARGGQLAIAWADGTLEVRPAADSGRSQSGWPSGVDGPQALAWTESGDALLVAGDLGRRLRRFDLRQPDRPRHVGGDIALGYGSSPGLSLVTVGEGVLIALEQGGLLQWKACDGACTALSDPQVAGYGPANTNRARLKRAKMWLPPVQDLDLSGDRALATAGDAGLFEMELSASAAPRLRRGLQVLDGGDGPPKLVSAGAIPASDPAPARALHLLSSLADGQLAYVQTADDGLLIIDMGDDTDRSRQAESAPRLIGHLPDLPSLTRATEMLQVDGQLYLAAGDGSLRVIDVRDPRSPRQIASLPNQGAQSLALASPGRRLLVGGTGAIGTGRLSFFDIADSGKLQPLAQVELDRFHEALLVAGDFAYLSGSSGFVEVVDLRDPRRPRLLPQLGIRGMPAGRLGQRGGLMLAAQTGRLDILRRLDSGALLPLARSNLPTAGDAWAGGTDVQIESGQALLLRGRSGIFAMPGMAEVAPEQEQTPIAMPGESPQQVSRRFLPFAMRGPLDLLPSPRPEAGVGAGKSGSCAAPSLLVLALERSILESAGSALAIADLAETLDRRTRSLALGGFGRQAELLAVDRPDRLAAALREGRQRMAMVPASEAAPSAGAARIDLAFALAERQWGSEREIARLGSESRADEAVLDAVAADVGSSAAMLLVMASPPREHSAALARSHADALRAEGWRLATATLGTAGEPTRFGALMADWPDGNEPAAPLQNRSDADLGAVLRGLLDGISTCP